VAYSKTEINLAFRLFNPADTCYVYDIVADGISLVNNYRQQFQRVVTNAGYEELRQQLREESRDVFVTP
jgi:phospholipid transport system substrate-binding protein